MAINAATNWYIRAGGNALNGGGWDSSISGAGTNYCDQDSPQLSLTDFATSGAGSTTLTSATGGFTSAMVGNCIRMASGTNFQTGYYFITVYTDTNTVTLDRTPSSGGAGSGGTGRLGGAFANPAASLSNGGTVTAPTLTSPLAAGHTINIRGGGTDNPASADYTQTGYATYPAGSLAVGRIRIIGYNGRPRIDNNGLCFHSLSNWSLSGLMFKFTGNNFAGYGAINGLETAVNDVYIDQAGYDALGINTKVVTECTLTNSGSTSAGTSYAIDAAPHGFLISGNLVSGWRGGGITSTGGYIGIIIGNIVANCRATSVPVIIVSTSYGTVVDTNTIYGCASDGVKILISTDIPSATIINNIIYGNGGYGINAAVGTLALNDRRRSLIDYNAFGNNTSGALNALSAGSYDITLTADPFVNAASGDFSLNSTSGGGLSLRAAALEQS